MPLIYNHFTGTLMDVPGPIAQLELKSGLGWHGPFADNAAANAFYEANKKADWIKPTSYLSSLGNLPAGIGAHAGESAKGALDAAASAISPFSDQNISAWFIRISEIILGVVLVGVGLARLTGKTNTVAQIVKVSKSAAKS